MPDVSAVSSRSNAYANAAALEAEAAAAGAAASLANPEKAVCKAPEEVSTEPAVVRSDTPNPQVARFIAAQKAAEPLRDELCHKGLKAGVAAGAGWATTKAIEAGAKAVSSRVPVVGALVASKVGGLAAKAAGGWVGDKAATAVDKAVGSQLCDRPATPEVGDHEGGSAARAF